MAQGATETPAKPNVMAAGMSWKRSVLEEKKTGAVI